MKNKKIHTFNPLILIIFHIFFQDQIIIFIYLIIYNLIFFFHEDITLFLKLIHLLLYHYRINVDKHLYNIEIYLRFLFLYYLQSKIHTYYFNLLMYNMNLILKDTFLMTFILDIQVLQIQIILLITYYKSVRLDVFDQEELDNHQILVYQL